MKRSRRQFLYLAAGAASLAVVAGNAHRFRSHTRRAHALGAETAITIWHDDHAEAERALEAAFDAIEDVEEVMSLYRPQSQLCQLNAEGFLKRPHPDLVRVLRYAQNLSSRTDGAFDVTVQPLWEARRLGTATAGRNVDTTVDWRRLEITEGELQFLIPGMAATLNGIAQGFAADCVGDALAKRGIQHALIDTGEVAALGKREGDAAWRVGVQHPRDPEAYLHVAGLSERCLATSGDYATTFTEDFGEHHLVDPRTGRSPSELSSVSVAAASAMEADALSTAAFVLGLEAGMALVADTPGADALMVRKADGRVFISHGFPRTTQNSASIS